MRALLRFSTTLLTLALAAPVLTAALACSDCEDFCQQQYDECNTGSVTDDPERCQLELDRCLSGCEAEPSGWDRLGE